MGGDIMRNFRTWTIYKRFKLFVINNKFPIIEFFIILSTALWVGRKYLDLNPNNFVDGCDFAISTVSHYVWLLINKCGSCVFWNGYINGGAPSFAEVQGAFFHPVVIVSTLIFGVVNGAKMIIVLSMIMIGFGQWWLSKELKLSFFPTIWTSMLAIMSGSIFGKLQAGNVTLVLSLASACLLLPAFVRFRKAPTIRNVALVAIFLALTWLSGQIYIQFIVVIVFLPVTYWYFLKKSKPRTDLWRGLSYAILFSVFLISIQLIPLIHFVRNIQLTGTNALDSIQPLEYTPLNLVIRDWSFYSTNSLSKDLNPWLHINFIGWIPVLLAIIGVYFIRESKNKRDLAYLIGLSVLVLVFSSKEIYLPIKNVGLINQFRFINLGASLAVQPILILAAITFQEIIDHKWTKINFTISSDKFSYNIPLAKWLVILFLMISSTHMAVVAGSKYEQVRPITIYKQDLALLDTDSSQWIKALNNDWVPFLLSQDKKLLVEQEWHWKNRSALLPYLEVLDSNSGEDLTGTVKVFQDHNLIEDTDQIYAFVENEGTQTPCDAHSLGGKIDVICNVDAPGTLIVRENNWVGWYAWFDGTPTQLDESQRFLTMPAQEGQHVYQFRYYPKDVYVGIIISAIGIVLFIVLFSIKKLKDQTF